MTYLPAAPHVSSHHPMWLCSQKSVSGPSYQHITTTPREAATHLHEPFFFLLLKVGSSTASVQCSVRRGRTAASAPRDQSWSTRASNAGRLRFPGDESVKGSISDRSMERRGCCGSIPEIRITLWSTNYCSFSVGIHFINSWASNAGRLRFPGDESVKGSISDRSMERRGCCGSIPEIRITLWSTNYCSFSVGIHFINSWASNAGRLRFPGDESVKGSISDRSMERRGCCGSIPEIRITLWSTNYCSFSVGIHFINSWASNAGRLRFPGDESVKGSISDRSMERRGCCGSIPEIRITLWSTNYCSLSVGIHFINSWASKAGRLRFPGDESVKGRISDRSMKKGGCCRLIPKTRIPSLINQLL